MSDDIVDRLKRAETAPLHPDDIAALFRVRCRLIEARAEIERLRAEIERLREERRWIPVKERLPPTDAEVLFTCEINGDYTDISIGKSSGRMNDIGSVVVMNENDDDWMPCTHYQSLPSRPAAEVQ